MSESQIDMEANSSVEDVTHSQTFTFEDNIEYETDAEVGRSSTNAMTPTESDSNEAIDQTTNDETIEDSESDIGEQGSSKTSRELKLLLALSKEANLDTNISYKRKTHDSTKIKDAKDSGIKAGSPELELLLKRPIKSVSSELKAQKFPVTAEAELEAAVPNDTLKTEKSSTDTLKRKKDSSSEVIEGATDSSHKKSRFSPLDDITSSKMGKDKFCWRCHRDGVNVSCETCPRSYHYKCLKQSIPDNDHWVCPECVSILKAESLQTRSEAMKGMTLEHLCGLLKFALKRMLRCQDSQPFVNPVSETEFPDYRKYIVQPMYLSLLEKNIKENLYGSTQAFEADAKWLLHNSIIFNSYQSKFTSVAKSMIKICKQEMAEIENCPSCYLNANTKKDTWFVEVCPKPHILVWAKLKGFPYWPAKAMCTNASGMVDVRFFGAHDRAWVPFKECYLYCRRDPNSHKQKKNDINECIKELEVYIDNLRKVYGEFHYAPFKTPFDPHNELKQLQIFLPRYKPGFKPRVSVPKSRTKSTESNPTSRNSPEGRVASEEKTPQQNGDVDNDMEAIQPIIPKVEDIDITMEGYGTDDESLLNPQIDDEVRRYRRRNSDASDNDEAEDRIESEAEEDSDSQMNNSLTFDTSPMRGKVRTRGGLNTSTGKLKFIPRMISANSESSTQKRSSPEDSPRNTPTKLSRRNSDQSVQSDSSRLSNISDKINRVDLSENMEFTLGNTDDGSINISGVESFSSENTVRENPMLPNTEMNSLFEGIKNPTQNNESTVPVQNKMKITEKLIKRLSESLDNYSSEKNENESPINEKFARKTTVILSEKPQIPEKQVSEGSTNMKKVEVNNKETPKDSGLSGNIESPPKSEKNDQPLANMLKVNAESTHQVKIPKDRSVTDKTKESLLMTELTKPTPSVSTTSVQMSSDSNIAIDKISQNGTSHAVSKAAESSSEQKTKETDAVKAQTNNLDHQEKTHTVIKITNVHSLCHQAAPHNDINNQVAVIEHSGDSDESLEYSQIDTANIRNIIHSSLNENSTITKVQSIEPPKESEDSTNKKRKFSESENTDTNVDQASKTAKLVFAENANLNRKDLSESTSQAKTSSSVIEKPLSVSESMATVCSQKIPSPSTRTANTRSSTESTAISATVDNTTRQPDNVIEIKSEPESDTEPSENDQAYMEAKRQYMSALNISEKCDGTTKTKVPEIRTRSKTEEIRHKHLDNLSRVIDDVAKNYSTSNQNKMIPSATRTDTLKTGKFEEQQIYVKPLSQMQDPQRHRARKTFSKPNYSITPPQRVPPILPKPLKNDGTHLLKKAVIAQSVGQDKNKANTDPLPTTASVVILQTQPNASCVTSLPPNQTIVYTTKVDSPVISISQPTSLSNTVTTKTVSQPPKPKSVNFTASQNYIPQNESQGENTTPSPPETPQEGNKSPASLITSLLNSPIVSSANQTNHGVMLNEDHESTLPATSEELAEFNILNGILPNNMCKEISNLLCKPMPKLKPRPPGPLSTTFDEGVPSSAGPVTRKINSVSHRLNDYFRGMLIELLDDLGKSDNKEATIALLKSEIEALKHSHALEIAEIRKNVCTTLKDVQKSILEDRERIIEETKAVCEAEAIKRIEEAKSKQWCANCSKEAQFYCCWNTSYCDYPCQQKHWAKHMNKCTQNNNNNNNQNQQQLQNRVRPTSYVIRHQSQSPKDGSRLVAKPTKVYVNRGLTTKNISHYKTAAGNQITLVESTPGNYELQGLGGPIAVSGKIVAALGKVKSATVVSSSPSTSTISGGPSNLPRVTNIIHAKSPSSILPSRSTTVSDESDD